MRRFLLSSSLALVLLGSLALTTADAQSWRTQWYGSYYYPGYSYTYVPPVTYSAPVVTAYTQRQYSYYPPVRYYAPTYSGAYYTPTYSGYYYAPRYYQPYNGGSWYSYGWRGW
jgi:hypothetical protein